MRELCYADRDGQVIDPAIATPQLTFRYDDL